MNIQPAIGECNIQPGENGLTFSIQPERELTLRRRTSHWKSIVVSLIIFAASIAPQTIHATTFSAADIIADTNAARTSQHLAPLITNVQLHNAAEAKARDMFAQQYFNHVSPTGTQPWSFITSAGYLYTTAGENLAIDFIDANDVVTAWLKSPEHRANLLSTAYHDIGVAVVDGQLNGQSTTIVVQLFGAEHVVTSTTTTTNTPSPTPVIKQSAPAPKTTTSQPKPPTQQPELSPLPAPSINQFASIDLTPALAHPNVAGVETEVIHSPTLAAITSSNNLVGDPRIALLVVATLGVYLTLLATLASLQQPAKTPAPAIA